MNEYQIRNGLRKHWSWLKDTDYDNVADFVIAHGNRHNKVDTSNDDMWDFLEM